MKKTKLSAGLMALLMAFSMTACSNTDSNSDKTESNGGDSSSATDATAELGEFTTKTDGSAKVTVEGTKFMVGDKELWINGCNSPWQNWNDFGGNFDFMFWQDHFKELHESGINAARIWIVCNGDVGMEISADGTFTGATTAHWSDIDDLILLAEQYNIYIMATVQSFDNFKDSNQNYEAWRALIQDSDTTDQFIDNYIIPMAKRYDSSDYFWSIDLCNEPDWVYENEESGNIDWQYLSSYYAKGSAAIHANSDILVTVGLGMPKYNSDNYEGNKIGDEYLQSLITDETKYDKSLAYVDFYSTHWYPWETSSFGNPFKMSPTDFGLDGTKPCVLGEFPATPTDTTLAEEYEAAFTNGWNGAMAWKASGQDDGNGTLADIAPATSAMLEAHEDVIFPLGYNEIA